MHIFIQLCVLLSIVLVDGKKSDCDYTSREYQVVLKPAILSGMNSFAHGVSLVLDELTAIENADYINFKVSRSSLKLKNVTSAKFLAQDLQDLNMKVTMKSRQKKIDEPADFVLKFSNPDPNLACVLLQIDNMYTTYAERKFELDFHAVNGKLMTKSAMSYSVNMPPTVKFSQTAPVNLSSIFINSAQKLTHSGRTIIGQPVGLATQQTAEFDMRVSNTKVKGTIILLQIGAAPTAEFSFKLKGNEINDSVLMTAQKLASILSRLPAIAMFAGSTAECAE